MNEPLHIDSAFSKIVVQDRGSIRTLYFVRDNGRRAIESQMDLSSPHLLRLRYTRSMFASYLLVPDPERVLFIGLGAGSMLRFLERYEPQLSVDAVDIDPVVLEVARQHFGVRESDRITLVAADGLDHLRAATQPYDVIYLDAFQKLSEGTDESGIPLHLKTADFYAAMGDRLTKGGAAVFNLHREGEVEGDLAPFEEDLAAIRRAFGSTHVFAVPRSWNIVVVATKRVTPAVPAELLRVAKLVDPRFRGEFSVADFVPDLIAP